MVKISELFEVASGDYHAVAKELDEGAVPLVSCGDTDNGVIGYYDIPPNRRHKMALTVAYNGSWPIMSKFHPYEFGAKDDVAVLTPRQPMTTLTLLYVATLFNAMTWRYSYGRKCFRDKLRDVTLSIPTKTVNTVLMADDAKIARLCPSDLSGVKQSILNQTTSWLGAIAAD